MPNPNPSPALLPLMIAATVCLGLALPPQASAATLQANTTAQYQSLVAPPAADTSFNLLTPATATSTVGVNSFSLGAGDARAEVKTLSMFAQASGFDPGFGPPNPVAADAEGRSVVTWRATSDTLPPGHAIDVYLNLRFDGSLAASEFFAPPGTQAGVSATVQTEVQVDANPVYAGGIVAQSSVNNGSDPPSISSSGAWSGISLLPESVDSGSLGQLPGWRMQQNDDVILASTVGDEFTVNHWLRVASFVDGPFETFTQADFRESPATYGLYALDPETGVRVDVQFLAMDGLSADSNGDGVVDGEDFLNWQRNFGQFDGAATQADGDANGDGHVDGEDFLIWQQQFADAGNDGRAATGVPEPTALGLLAILAAFATTPLPAIRLRLAGLRQRRLG